MMVQEYWSWYGGKCRCDEEQVVCRDDSFSLVRKYKKPAALAISLNRFDAKSFSDLTSGLNRVSLTARQRQVLELRAQGITLAAIAVRLGISTERVRQIEARLKSRARRQTQGVF